MAPLRALLEPFRRSLRARVTVGLLLLLVLILGTFTMIESARHEAALYSNLSFLAAQSGEILKNSLRHAMLTRDLAGLQHMFDSIGEDSTLRHVYLLDTNGRVAFAPNQEGVGTELHNTDPTCQPCHSLPADQRPRSVVVTLADGERVFRSMKPIENDPACQACHDPNQRLIGLLLTDISMAPLEAPLAADRRGDLLWGLAVIAVTVLVVNLVMGQMVMRRLQAVARKLAGFGRGQLDQRLPAEPPDEIGQVAAAFNAMGERLQSEEAENRELAGQRQQLLKRLITLEEEERRRIARDLHDDLGQDLAGLAFGLEALERLNGNLPAPAAAHVRLMRQRVASATERVYDMIVSLRPSSLDDLGLGPAVRSLAERTLAPAGVSFDLTPCEVNRRLPPEAETALFRIVQEALQNIVRHAQARHVRITLCALPDGFEVEVADDGQGFDPAAVRAEGHSLRGMGLLGMRERAAQFGGRLQIVSQPAAGTRLRVELPWAGVRHD
jgi:signal transduction histidine kinase